MVQEKRIFNTLDLRSAELPGIKEYDVSVDVKDNVLTIKGERSFNKTSIIPAFERFFCEEMCRDLDAQEIGADQVENRSI